MVALKNYENNVIYLVCEVCGQDSQYILPANYEPLFNKEVGSYENLIIHCEPCRQWGRNVTHVVNLNLPEFEEAELTVLELEAPAEEVQSRAVVRNIMWAKRPDLKKLNREQARQNYISLNAAAIEKARQQINLAKAAQERGNNSE